MEIMLVFFISFYFYGIVCGKLEVFEFFLCYYFVVKVKFCIFRDVIISSSNVLLFVRFYYRIG